MALSITELARRDDICRVVASAIFPSQEMFGRTLKARDFSNR
jgi:hypothetical protein